MRIILGVKLVTIRSTIFGQEGLGQSITLHLIPSQKHLIVLPLLSYPLCANEGTGQKDVARTSTSGSNSTHPWVCPVEEILVCVLDKGAVASMTGSIYGRDHMMVILSVLSGKIHFPQAVMTALEAENGRERVIIQACLESRGHAAFDWGLLDEQGNTMAGLRPDAAKFSCACDAAPVAAVAAGGVAAGFRILKDGKEAVEADCWKAVHATYSHSPYAYLLRHVIEGSGQFEILSTDKQVAPIAVQILEELGILAGLKRANENLGEDVSSSTASIYKLLLELSDMGFSRTDIYVATNDVSWLAPALDGFKRKPKANTRHYHVKRSKNAEGAADTPSKAARAGFAASAEASDAIAAAASEVSDPKNVVSNAGQVIEQWSSERCKTLGCAHLEHHHVGLAVVDDITCREDAVIWLAGFEGRAGRGGEGGNKFCSAFPQVQTLRSPPNSPTPLYQPRYHF